jgi:hypothetical protein
MLTDEAPALATAAFVRAFTAPVGINVVTSDISVAARILGEFPEFLTEEQRMPDDLAELGRQTLLPGTNIISYPTSAPRWRSWWRPSRSCSARLQDPGLPRESQIGRREGNPGTLCQVHRQCRESGGR